MLMFDSLKKKLKESVEKLTKKAEEPLGTKPEELFHKEVPKPLESPKTAVEKPHKAEKAKVVEGKPQEHAKAEIQVPKPSYETPEKGLFGRIKEKVVTREISGSDIDEFFAETETGLLESNVALEAVDFLKQRLKENLAKKQAKRFGAKDAVKEAFEDSLFDVLNQGNIDLEQIISRAKAEGRPACLIFLGFNGSGKTTSIAKLAYYMKENGHAPVLAAADTFRAASIEQLEVHGEKLGIKVIKHQYGADSAAVIFDAIKYAKTKGCDIVLADTAGRSHTDKNLMDELSKVTRVNKPDLRVLVVDSLTGNDAVEQAKTFQKAAGVDAIVLTKIDVNKKGGAILSVCYAIKKPILFLGTGQEYGSIEMFEPRKFARELLE